MKVIFKRVNTTILLSTLISCMLLLTHQVKTYALFDNSKSQACAGLSITGSDSTCNSDKSSNSINKVITAVVNLLSLVVGIVAVIMIIVAGSRFILSGGDSNSINSARNTMLYALVGLVVVAMAQMIVHFVISKVFT